MGLYQPAERFARTALENSAAEERAMWELHIQQSVWLRSQIKNVGRRAIRIAADELAAELANENEEKK